MIAFLGVIPELILSAKVLQQLELKAFDFLMQQRPAEKTDSRLLIVEATEEDIQKYGYPIPDRTLAQLIEKLEQYHPQVIGLHILREQVITPRNNLIYVCNHQAEKDPNNPGNPPPEQAPEERIGFGDVLEDSDGVIRRHLLFMRPGDTSPCQTSLSFSFQLASYYLQGQGIQPKTTPEGYTKLNKTVLKKLTSNTWNLQKSTWSNFLAPILASLNKNTGVYEKEDLRGYQLLLNYRFSQDREIASRVTLKSVLENKVASDSIKDKIVIVGNTSLNQSSYWSTPYTQGRDQKISGVGLQAQMVSQILSAVLDDRLLLRFFPKWGDILWVWFWVIVGAIVAWVWHRQIPLLLLTDSIAIVILGLSCFVLLLNGYWVPFVRPALALIITSGGILLFFSKF